MFGSSACCISVNPLNWSFYQVYFSLFTIMVFHAHGQWFNSEATILLTKTFS
jgi:hypothetical protein